MGMELRVLGCSGGIGGKRRTTALLLNGEVLIDAGSGVMDLGLDEMARIRHIFLTHSHLDHLLAIPLLLDSIFERIKAPVTIHAQPHTIKALREHIFNWIIWPDFSELPNKQHPVVSFKPMRPGECRELGALSLEMIPVNHIVPAVAYAIHYPGGILAFSGDTTSNDSLWQGLNALPRLDHLIVEVAFPSKDLSMCEMARHYCPQLLAEDLLKLQHQPQIYLSHAKPGAEETIFAECHQLITKRPLSALTGGEVLAL